MNQTYKKAMQEKELRQIDREADRCTVDIDTLQVLAEEFGFVVSEDKATFQKLVAVRE